MLADLNINGNNLINTDQIIGLSAVTITDSTSTSTVIIGDNGSGLNATHISGITEFTGTDPTRKMKIDCNGGGPFMLFNSNYKSFLDPFQFGGQEGWRLGISNTTDTN